MAPYAKDEFSGSKNPRRTVSPNVRLEHHSNEKALEWKPLGIVGCFEVDFDTFEDAIVHRTEVSPDPGFQLDSYKYSAVVVEMALWLEANKIWRRDYSLRPNTGVFVKLKTDGTKLQVISDARGYNSELDFYCKSFCLCQPDDVKPILRCEDTVFFSSFDISNFFHGMVLPRQIIEKYPVVTKVIMEDGSIVPFVSNRFVFGACYSPVVTHLALCRKLGWKPTVFDKSKEERPQIAMSDPFKTAFIDDVLIASTEREKSISEKRRAQQVLRECKFSFKETSDHEGVSCIDFAGKFYDGVNHEILNTNKNMAKAMGLCILLSCTDSSRNSFARIPSFIGSISFLTSHHRKAFCFLNRLNKKFISNDLSPFSKKEVDDMLTSFKLACSPWSARREIVWTDFDFDIPCIFVDGSHKFGLIGVVVSYDVRNPNATAFSYSFKVPTKYMDDQQSVELYGGKRALFLAQQFGWNVFSIVQDSVTSLMSLHHPKMVTGSKRRNDLVRSIILRLENWGDFRVKLAYLASENHPADEFSHSVGKGGLSVAHNFDNKNISDFIFRVIPLSKQTFFKQRSRFRPSQ